jgi:hypothetical protein
MLCPPYAWYRMCLRDNGTTYAVSASSVSGHIVVVMTWTSQKLLKWVYSVYPGLLQSCTWLVQTKQQMNAVHEYIAKGKAGYP